MYIYPHIHPLRLFSHESKSAQFEWFELRNLNDHSNDGILDRCVRKITLRCIIWNAQFKWRSRGVFQLRISQITQRNRCMNALTSKLWFGGRSYVTFKPLPPIYRALHYVQEHRKRKLCVCLAGYPDMNEAFLLLWNAKPQFRSLVCTLRSSNIAIASLVCKLRNSKW